MAYPGNPQGTGWDGQLSDVFPGNNYGNVDLSAYPLNLIELPPNITDPQGDKPMAQSHSTEFWNDQLGVISDQLEYVRFYAYLHMVSDKHIGTVLNALESRPALHNNTLVFRFSDHGEMGLSHNMRQKAYNAYEETIHVPLVVSNPILFPEPAQTSALASLIDLMPTLATIAGIPDREKYTFRGTDLTPIILDAINDPTTPSKPVQDSVLFTTDENLGSLQEDNYGNPIYVTQPYRIRCLRDEQWKIVMYFDHTDINNKQFELYDLVNDPLEQYNQAQSNPGQLAIMIEKLSIKMEETHTTPIYDTGTSIL
jgi:arylsulfatase A-like enzyme